MPYWIKVNRSAPNSGLRWFSHNFRCHVLYSIILHTFTRKGYSCAFLEVWGETFCSPTNLARVKLFASVQAITCLQKIKNWYLFWHWHEGISLVTSDWDLGAVRKAMWECNPVYSQKLPSKITGQSFGGTIGVHFNLVDTECLTAKTNTIIDLQTSGR